ncbi:MAG: FHA domain-containing protein [Anaerolineae bacterium]|nr:FHA domain-containing protein [Anaerolineae bacterium]
MSEGHRLILMIDAERHGSVTLTVDHRIVVGRSDPAEPPVETLGLDLAPYGGERSGVSRVHAALFSDVDGIYVEDLESTSGTFLNGLRLLPSRPYRLRGGDELELGRARVTVRL